MSLFSDINTWDVGRTLEKVENHEPIGKTNVPEYSEMVY